MTAQTGVANHDVQKQRVGILHRKKGRPITAKRNRQDVRTACGLRLLYALPVPFDDGQPGPRRTDLCGRCWPVGGAR